MYPHPYWNSQQYADSNRFISPSSSSNINTGGDASRQFNNSNSGFFVNPVQQPINIRGTFHENLTPARSSTSDSWMQTIPSTMPWTETCFTGFSSSYPPQNNLSMFNANAAYLPVSNRMITQSQLNHRKRRSADISYHIPHKVYINEAKVAESLNSMHISEDYVVPMVNNDQQSNQSSTTTVNDEHDEFCDMLESEPSHQSIVMSEELKQLCKSHANSLQDQTLQKLFKPSLAVVLWQPPGGIVNSSIRSRLPDKSSKTEFSTSDEFDNANKVDNSSTKISDDIDGMDL